MTQGTDEWRESRRGYLGASAINDARATIKAGEAASRRNLRARIIAERLTGVCEETFSSTAMQWGVDNEPIARAMYETTYGIDVEQCDFIRHPEIKMTGASPDGLIGDDGLIEIKCPNTATHIDYLLAGVVPAQYKNQMLWQMECTGRKWCDFVSYDPRMPEHMQLFCIRFERDEEELISIRAAVLQFLSEVDEVITKLQIISQGRK